MPGIVYFGIVMLIQGSCMMVDEFHYHYRRKIPQWERLGHPLDTLMSILVFVEFAFVNPSQGTPWWIIATMIFSCLFVTKDEWVHRSLCEPGEQWLHSLLFMIHPVVFGFAWFVWHESGFTFLHTIQLGALSLFFVYQVIYWNLINVEKKAINNDFYHDLGDQWYHSQDDAIAMLRAEGKIKNPWVIKEVREKGPLREPHQISILDIGCGAGFLTNELAEKGFRVTGLDFSESTLEVARKFDLTKSVAYVSGDAYTLPFEDSSFDVVTCMDFLEHVERPQAVIQEASRVLKQNGILIFHTFNRNWLSRLVIIKGVEWFIKNAPNHLHVIELFIKPGELKTYCKNAGFNEPLFSGIAPQILSRSFFKLILLGKVDPSFKFKLMKSTAIAYLGSAIKN